MFHTRKLSFLQTTTTYLISLRGVIDRSFNKIEKSKERNIIFRRKIFLLNGDFLGQGCQLKNSNEISDIKRRILIKQN